METWRDIPGYEGLYQASAAGEIRSLIASKKHPNGCLLRANRVQGDYQAVNLYKDGVSRKRTLHRLVMSAFYGWPDFGVEVNHIDGDKKNNRLENLEFCSRKDNANHAWRMNLLRKPPAMAGSKNPNASISEQDAEQIITLLANGTPPAAIAERFRCSPNSVYMIKYGRTWKHLARPPAN